MKIIKRSSQDENHHCHLTLSRRSADRFI